MCDVDEWGNCPSWAQLVDLYSYLQLRVNVVEDQVFNALIWCKININGVIYPSLELMLPFEYNLIVDIVEDLVHYALIYCETALKNTITPSWPNRIIDRVSDDSREYIVEVCVYYAYLVWKIDEWGNSTKLDYLECYVVFDCQ